MKICPNCGHQNPENVNFCENCGADLTTNQEAQKQCPQCQTMNPVDSRFCENCGYDFSAVTSEKTSAQSEKQPVANKERATDLTPTPPESPQVADNKATSSSEKQSKRQWIISALVLLLLIGSGVYLVSRGSTSSSKPKTTQVTPKKHHSEASQSSSTSASSEDQSVHFDQSTIKDDVTTALGSLEGTSSAYVVPVEGTQSVLVNDGSQSAASSIKLFILVTAYAMAKEGIFNLDDTHTLTASEKVGGTGKLQDMATGTKLTYREILTYMIDDSDNTAANIIIDKLGGFGLINEKIKSMGATATKLRRKMMDTEAIDAGHDNTTSARDLGVTLKKMYNHQLVSRSADGEMLAILKKNTNRSKLPKLLPSEAHVYNKTGEFSDYGVQNDAEIVANRRGAFVAVVLSENGKEDAQVTAMNQLGLKLYQNILE